MIWYFKFSNPDIDRNDYAFERRKTFDTVDDLKGQISKSLDFFWSLEPNNDVILYDADITRSTERFLC